MLSTPVIGFVLMYDPDYVISHVITGTGSLVLIDGSVIKAIIKLLWVVALR